jgi:hypothetical protein
MTEKWGFCNLTGVTRMIGFKTGLVNCRVAAYLNNGINTDLKKLMLFQTGYLKH